MNNFEIEGPMCPRCFDMMIERLEDNHVSWICSCATVFIPDNVIHIDTFIKRHLKIYQTGPQKKFQEVAEVKTPKERELNETVVRREVASNEPRAKKKITQFGRSEK